MRIRATGQHPRGETAKRQDEQDRDGGGLLKAGMVG